MLYPVVSSDGKFPGRFLGRFSRRGRAIQPSRRSEIKVSLAVGFTVERLEERRLLSVAQAGSLLTINGTADADTIVVELVPGDSTHLQVTGAGSSNTYAVASVKQININGLAGDDSITVNVAIKSKIVDGDGNDTLVGGSAARNTLIAGNGNDSITANGAYDILTAGNGDDTLLGGGGGHNTLKAGNGTDSLTGGGGYNSLTAGTGNDTLTSGPGGHSRLIAGNGSDTLTANGAYDYLKAGDGDDILVGSIGGHDTLLAGKGTDSLTGNGTYDYLSAGNGDDTLVSGLGGHSTLLAGNGADSLTSNGAFDYLKAGDGNDILVGSVGGHDHLIAGKGTDSLTANGIYDYLSAGNGNDVLVGGPGGHETLLAGNGNDSLTATGAYNYLRAGNGNDTLTGGDGGHNTLLAGSGNDTLTSTGAYDYVGSGNGSDTLTGGAGGHNHLLAGSGIDILQAMGNPGNWLQAGAGNDTMYGGAADTFHVGAGINLISKDYGVTTLVKTARAMKALPHPTGASTASFHNNDILGPNGIFNGSSSVGYNNIDTIEAAYSIPDPTQAGNPDGAGQTIAIIDAYGPSPATVTSDLTFFSLNPPLDTLGSPILSQSSVALLGGASIFGPTNPGATLPVPTTSQSPSANQFTFNTVLATPTGATPIVNPISAADQATETDLDVEWAHAIAPKAKIMLFEAASLAVSDLMFAVNQAALFLSAHGGGVVSMSFGGGEFAGETQFDQAVFGNPAYKNVSFLASSGDTGGEASYPALSPFVTSVGGTTLLTSYVQSITTANGVFPWLEYAWTDEGAATSQIEQLPQFQAFTSPGHVAGTISIPPGSQPFGGIGQFRAGPDVVMLADPETGVAVYGTSASQIPGLGQISGWEEVGGTSLSCPLFAGVVALANQSRATLGTKSDSNGDTTLGAELNGAIYFLNNSEYEQPPRVATPGTDKNVMPAAPILGNFQSRGELGGTADVSVPVPDPTIVPPPPPTEAPVLNGVTGLFYDIGGAFTDKGAADHSQGIVGGGINTNLAWDAATGWGSPNVNNLVEANPSTNPNTVPFIGIDIGPGTTEGGGQITFGAGSTPILNLSNVPINLDTFSAITGTKGGGTGITQPIVAPFTIKNLKVSVIQYTPFVTPPNTGPISYRDPGILGSTAVSANAGQLVLTLIASTQFTDPTNPTPTVLTETFTGGYNIATGQFAGQVAGTTLYIQGQITQGGAAISGTFYTITGFDANGNPIPADKNDPGGDIVGNFNSQ